MRRFLRTLLPFAALPVWACADISESLDPNTVESRTEADWVLTGGRLALGDPVSVQVLD